jgi:hypothetical protein
MATLAANALVTLAQGKDHLDIPAGDTDYDDRITHFINVASEDAEQRTSRFLAKRSGLVEYQSGRRNNRILLPPEPRSCGLARRLFVHDGIQVRPKTRSSGTHESKRQEPREYYLSD